MSGLLNLRENYIGGRSIFFVFKGAGTTAAIPGKAEIQTGIGDAVHFAGGLLVAHAIDLIVVGPERLVLGVEVHADRVAQSNRINLAVLAITIHADDPAHANLAVKVKLLFRGHVVGLTQLNIELVVRADPACARRVVIAPLGLRDQFAFGDDDTCNNVRALIEEFGRRIFQHAILLGDVKEAVLREAPAIGYLLWQGRSELLHLVADAAARAIGHHPNFRLARP